MNGRTALGACLVLLAVVAGTIFLDRAQRLVPVYAAARDLPAGVPLKSGDLMVIRVRLPASALRHYLRPSAGRALAGRVLAAPVRRERLVPAELVFASSQHADLVELPVQVDAGDMAQGLRPGDSVQVLAAFTEGARRGRAVVLLPTAEVVRVLEDATGLTGSGEERGVQLRMPSDRAPAVVAAIATARIFVVKAPGPATTATSPTPAPGPDPASARIRPRTRQWDRARTRRRIRPRTRRRSRTRLGPGIGPDFTTGSGVGPEFGPDHLLRSDFRTGSWVGPGLDPDHVRGLGRNPEPELGSGARPGPGQFVREGGGGVKVRLVTAGVGGGLGGLAGAGVPGWEGGGGGAAPLL